jgi:alkylated DNA repair dioxygenase AlkB
MNTSLFSRDYKRFYRVLKIMGMRQRWRAGTDCKSVAFGLSRFESYHSHIFYLYYRIMEGVSFIDKFLEYPDSLFEFLKSNVEWDERMSARKTASFGVSYNYSQMNYPYNKMPDDLSNICIRVKDVIGFEPNNCLINYYLDGKSKMGFHSDQTDILEANTGIVIVSLGETRVLRFRRINNFEEVKDFELPSGSLIYMNQKVQDEWQHAIPKSDTENGRMSLTLRRIK